MSSSADGRASAGGLAERGSLAALAVLLLSPGLWLGPWLDAAVFVQAGARIRAGYMPYRDLWDHKPPGSYLVNLAGQVALPWLDPWLVSWLISAVFVAVSVLICHSLLSERLSRKSAYFWSALSAFGIAGYPVALGGGYTETFAVLPLLATFWIVVKRPASLVSAGVAGLLLGMSCLISLQSVPAAAVLLSVVVRDATDARDVRALVGRVLALTGAGLAIPLAVLAWLAIGGALGDAVDQLVRYNASYRDSNPGVLAALPLPLAFMGCLVIPAAIAIVRMVRSPMAFGRISWVALAWLVSVVAYQVYQGRMELHYIALVFPPLVLLAGPGVGFLRDDLRSIRARTRLLAVGIAGVGLSWAALCLVMAVLITQINIVSAAKAKTNADAAAAWIRGNTPASASMFVWGDDTFLYLMTDRPQYDRYVYEFPLVTQGYWSSAATADLLADWEASPPRLIVEGRGAVPLFGIAQDINDGRNLDTLEPLRRFVRDRYEFRGAFGGYGMYVLVGP